MGARKDHKKLIINEIIKETGYSKKMVEAVIDSFIGIYTDKVSDGTVHIQGFGTMTAVMGQRRYYDINQRKMDETHLKPSVRFKPTNSFLNLIRHSQGRGKEGGDNP